MFLLYDGLYVLNVIKEVDRSTVGIQSRFLRTAEPYSCWNVPQSVFYPSNPSVHVSWICNQHVTVACLQMEKSDQGLC